MQYRTFFLAFALLTACSDTERSPAKPARAHAADPESDASGESEEISEPDDEWPSEPELPAIPEIEDSKSNPDPKLEPEPKPEPRPDSEVDAGHDPTPADPPAAPKLEVESSFSAAIARWSDSGARDYGLKLTAANAEPREFEHVSSPFYIPALTNGTLYTVTLIAKHDGDAEARATAYARPGEPVFDGAVRALAAIGTNTYVGGEFEHISLHTGAVIATDPETGFSDRHAVFPVIDGEVNAVLRVQGVGFVIGGRFSTVGGQPRANLARIREDGTLDADWNPGADGAVRAIVRSKTGFWVGGDFTRIGGQARTGLAELDASGGVTTFDPKLDGGVTALALAPGKESRDQLVVAGAFSNVASRPCARLALIEWRGNTNNRWSCPNPNGAVSELAVTSYREYFKVYVGGAFTSIAGTSQRYFAVLDATGKAESTRGMGHVQVDGPVSSIAVSFQGFPAPTLQKVWLAGDFTTVNGVSRPGVAALDANWKVSEWNPAPEPGGSILDILQFGERIYLAGFFTKIGGVERRGAAAVSAGGEGAPTRWNPRLNGPGYELSYAFDDTTGIIVSGAFSGVGGVRRDRLAAFLESGELASWNPGADASVDVLATAGNTIYAGGSFESLGGQARARLGAIDASGSVTAWDPQADGRVSALATWGGTVYAGGSFENIGGASRARLAALAADGHATTWNPGANGVVRALLTDGPTVYIGGDFTRLGAAARERIAQVDAASGLVTAWNPGADATVHALTRAGGAVIAGGAFENIGGAARPHLAALDAVSGGATSWTPAPDAPVRAVASYDGVLYVAGQFRSISDANRSIAAYDETFSLLDYAPVLDGAVFALSVGQVAHAGGDFSIAFAPLQLAR